MKVPTFYRISKNDDNQTIYNYLIGNSNTIHRKSVLSFKFNNFAMNQNYQNTDEDLFQFRTDITRMNKELKIVDIFQYSTINKAVNDIFFNNINHDKIQNLPKINFKELHLFENCLNSGLMTINKKYLNVETKCYGYDYKKFYFNMLQKIHIPISEPEYHTIETIDFKNLGFGLYRCKIICHSEIFNNIFNFNKNNIYTHNTLKVLYQYKDLYNIEFELLQPDNEFDYNKVLYTKTIEFKILAKIWIKMMKIILSKCENNFIAKALVSQLWGNVIKYKKQRVHDEKLSDYDYTNIDKIDYTNKYEHYEIKHTDDFHYLVDADDAFAHPLARLKPFLTAYCRNYIFNFLSENNLAKNVIRIQTDGIVFNKKYNFCQFDYAPIPENKTTGKMIFNNINKYHKV